MLAERFNMPTQTIPMLSKKPKKATADLHKDILGTRNPGLGYMAKRAQPALYDADTLFHPTHHPVSIWDSEEVLVHQVVSMKKMNEKPGQVRLRKTVSYDKLNALKVCSLLNRTLSAFTARITKQKAQVNGKTEVYLLNLRDTKVLAQEFPTSKGHTDADFWIGEMIETTNPPTNNSKTDCSIIPVKDGPRCKKPQKESPKRANP
ncbi:hypothetical protein Tco_1012777 [Tanacetum coccineum]